MKKGLSLGIAVLLTMSAFNSTSLVSAKEYTHTENYAEYKPGVTVKRDPHSPTGYYATFIYEDKTKAAKIVELYSDTFKHFTIEDGFTKPYRPEDYKKGMFPGGGDGNTTYSASMKKLKNNLWGAQVPLSSGAFVYNFRITNLDGTVTGRLDDPNNPTLLNTATGIDSLSSMVYVPYNSKTMGTGDWLDRSVEMPRKDTKTGTVETVSYVGAAKDTRGLAVYLPDNYDPNRKEPYKVLYLSHGTSGDPYGNELRWMNEGAVANIMDNLIADKAAEPFVVVTMNNQDFAVASNNGNWDQQKIEEDQINHIMPYVESHYNVSTSPEGRAYAGLSRGGIVANWMYFHHADKFDYFGIWSYAVTGNELKAIDTAQNLEGPSVMLGTGIWDFGLEPVQTLGEALKEKEINSTYVEVPGAHDWETWQLLYAEFVEDYLWKADKNPGETATNQKETFKQQK